MRKLFLIITALAITITSTAQTNKKAKRDENRKRINEMIKQEEEGVITYKKQTIFGGKLTTDGYGIFMEIGRANSVKRSTLYTLELSEHKDRKEERSMSTYVGGNAYVFGKINNFYNAKLGIAEQFLFGNKSNKNGVNITFITGAGLSLGLLKPYVLDTINSVGSDKAYGSYKQGYDSVFLNRGRIYGGTSFTKGFNELKIKPGAYVKTAMRFDYGRYNELVSAIEVGVMLDAYSEKIPIILTTKEKQLFFTGYVAFMFGRRR